MNDKDSKDIITQDWASRFSVNIELITFKAKGIMVIALGEYLRVLGLEKLICFIIFSL